MKRNQKKRVLEDFNNLDNEVPVNYRLMEESTAKAFLVPIESDFHNDKMYHSYGFYKPISKYQKPS